MRYPDDKLEAIANMQAQINPFMPESSLAKTLMEQFHAVSSTQKIIDDVASLRESLAGNAWYAAQQAQDSINRTALVDYASSLSGIGHDIYASELAAAKHALGIGSTAYDLAREYTESLKAISPYINELEKLQKSLTTSTYAAELAQINAGLHQPAAKYIKELAESGSTAAEASIQALLDQASGRITAFELEAQRPHIAMDAFQRATTWLMPHEDFKSVTLREAEKYRALYSVAQPLELLRDIIGATAPNPFADYASSAAVSILESLRSIGIDGNLHADEESEDAVDVGDEDLAPYAAIAQTQLANQVALDRASIEALVSSLTTAYQKLQSSRQKQIFQIYIYPLLLNLIFSWINPYHDFIIKQKLESPKPVTEKVIQQNARNSGAPAYVLESFRFVSARALSVRINGKARSPEIGTLRFGQPVEIIRRQDDWTLIRYSDSDNEVEIQGWVLSRYLKKFR